MKKESRKLLKKMLIGIATVALLTVIVIFTWQFLSPILELASDPDRFRAWVDAQGASSRLLYALAVLLQVVVAVIPGEPLELVGGYAFGVWEGTAICLLSTTLGSLVVFLLVRKFGMRLVQVFFSKEKLNSLSFLKSSPKRSVLFFVVFSIPGTPKDLLCYFAGLTDMRFSTWMVICTVGRIPSLVTSTVGGSALGDGSHLLALILFAVTLLISGIGFLIYQRICKQQKELSADGNKNED